MSELNGPSTRETVLSALDISARDDHCVFFAGLPGVGKSLFVKELAQRAAANGRRVSFMMWDGCRAAFETPAILDRYPETNGETHPAIRLAVGLWARRAIERWDIYKAQNDILIGELPVVGARFVELLQRHSDGAEAILGREDTSFFIPVPTEAIRAKIEKFRTSTIAHPRHEKEHRDAPVDVVRGLWRATYKAARELGLVKDDASRTDCYDAEVYRVTFQHMTRHRHARVLDIDFVFNESGSVYDVGVPANELLAMPDEVEKIFERIEREYTADIIAANAELWHHV